VTFTAEEAGTYEVFVRGFGDGFGSYSVSIESSRPYWERILDEIIRRLERLEELNELDPEP
jgi:hypothetical protein